MPPVVLASASPRRRRLLALLLDDFEVVPADLVETMRPAAPPPDVAEDLAQRKADLVAADHPDAVVLASDTVVDHDGRVLGKVGSKGAARAHLMDLNHGTHRVWTGVAVARDGRLVGSAVAGSLVRLDVPPRVIDAYVTNGGWQGKAGAYGIQDPMLSPHVAVEEGSWSNVVGLPLAETARLLRAHGVSCRDPPLEEAVPDLVGM